ncbi:hypothetical protein ABIB35_001024 [Arthrobacter sp. UYP6]
MLAVPSSGAGRVRSPYRPNSFPNQPEEDPSEAGVLPAGVFAAGFAVAQVQRSFLETPFITWSTWFPHPAHVVLPHFRQVTALHIFMAPFQLLGNATSPSQHDRYPRGYASEPSTLA